MLVSDLLHSCAHEDVAEAAVASIGGDLVERLQAEAGERGVSVGRLAAGVVRSFAREASERDWRDLVDACRGQDVPVLCGLRIILTRPRGTRRIDQRHPSLPAAWIASARGEGCCLGR